MGHSRFFGSHMDQEESPDRPTLHEASIPDNADSGQAPSAVKPENVACNPVTETDKVILAYDGTPESEKAAIHTRQLLGPHPQETVIVVTVVALGEGDNDDEEEIAALMANARASLKKKVKELRNLGYKAEGVLASGDVLEILSNMADFHCPKMLVIARADYESIGQPAIDSVADQLSRKLTCPVLIVS